MKLFKIVLILIMVFSVMGLNFPQAVFAGKRIMFAEAEDAGITENMPEMLSSEEIDIPVETVKKEKKKGNGMLWKSLSAALLVGVLAVGLGGSGGGGGGGGDDGGGGGGGDGTGDVSVSW
jgi:uncharacterized membrane protein YgcG